MIHKRNCTFGLVAVLAAFASVSLEARKPEETYALPFSRKFESKLLQGNDGPYGHQGHSRYAYDFQMPIGTPVLAARAGEVVHVVASHPDGTRKPGQENVVVIRHDDKTYSRYYHLSTNGAAVSVGQRVKQGQKVGLSGDSGASAGPHLHFDVTKDCFEWGCQTVTVQFAGTGDHPLKMGTTYRGGF